MAEKHKSIILGITGASGTVYGLRLLEYLLSQGYVVDVVFSNNALKVSKLELDQDWEGLNVQLLKQAVLAHLFKNFNAEIEDSDTVAKRTSSRLRRTNDRSVLGVHEDHEDDENAEIGVRQQCHGQSRNVETTLDIDAVKKRVNFWHESNIAASIASGSYQVEGMVVSPCSVGTLAHIALGTSHNLISRAADVMLKERKKLILVVRETPFSSIHLRNMLTLSDAGAVILPAIPAFYHRPHSIQDQVDFITGKTLDSLGIDSDLFKRWR